MASKLKAGAMGGLGGSNNPSEYVNSLALEMEEALNDILVAEGREPIDTNNNDRETRDRRILFLAIAQGIVRHMKANQSAFRIRRADNSVSSNWIDLRTDPDPP